VSDDLVNFLLNFSLRIRMKNHEEDGPRQRRRRRLRTGGKQVHRGHPQLFLLKDNRYFVLKILVIIKLNSPLGITILLFPKSILTFVADFGGFYH
jgi:hypothetical protein